MTAGVYAIGDSVMQGAGPDLYATLPATVPGIEVDAAPNRHFKHAPSILRARLETEPRPETLVIHLGTNGIFADTAFDDLLEAAHGVPTVLVVTIKAPREWETAVNQRLSSGVKRHARQSSLLDWWSLATGEPGHLRADGFHLSATGAIAYAEAIATAIAAARE